jgi:anti-sigma factor RsiW
MQMQQLLHRVSFLRDHRWVPPHASEYLDGGLESRGRRRIERHTGACSECRELLRNLRALIAALETIRDDEPTVVAAAVLASIHSRLSGLPQDEP